MLTIYEKTKVYVLLPAGVRTAGPEFLHQLAFYLRNHLDIQTYLCCIPLKHKNPVPEQYRHYNNPLSIEIEDVETNIIISPEIVPLLSFMSGYNKIRKVIWWLSIDNYYLHKYFLMKKKYGLLLKALNKVFNIVSDSDFVEITELARRKFEGIELAKEPLVSIALVNICSARHVERTLNEHNLKNVIYISELLNEKYLTTNWNRELKENIIAYNPAKGTKFTNFVLKHVKDIQSIALKKMNREEIIFALKRAKVYIDFGNHPGRDRLPREAAVLGCCIITSKRGGAELFEDLSISDSYKFYDNKSNIQQILQTINTCIFNYDKRIADFEYYRQSIKEEPHKFLSGLKENFVKA